MKVNLKKLPQQVVVITGASSGIGLVTARMAAKKGAKLVLAARSEEALQQLTSEIQEDGGQATYVVADVSSQEEVQRIAQVAQEQFGGFDTWVNNAGVSIYGKLEEVPIEDMRKLFETNVWGLIYGSLEAAKHLKQRGGTIINVGSILSETTAILQSIYSASKHAVKGFTDGLRMELELDEAPISVTLIKPAAIDTPYPLHAKNFMEREAKHAPPAYAPETVARAILHAAETPTREITVGGGGKMMETMNHWVPRLLDKFMENVFVKQEQAEYPAGSFENNGLDGPTGKLEARGNYDGHTRETSLYTTAVLHPAVTAAAVVGAGVVLAAWLGKSSGRKFNGKASGHTYRGVLPPDTIQSTKYYGKFQL
ncbi:SDR family oxidoreductase [Hymenobacter sp. YC55]|uniref:SDR family oxidoreductase n=1 Tax=Hymenobacter sp. YC55 TaxID=3034019 RepID=UPI0023F6DFD5|nr:SDR family oxidoreductase [Hymenobacter sp. YC55]MDF7810128.1 SDR family oxidoreductase [Hymenobacter sp. YC55]